jgi:uncharacterized SAM-binding protein YcdF (DUF218 family)
MSLSALPTALLIPPMNLVPLGLAGLVLARYRPLPGRAVTWAAMLGLLVLGMPFASQSLIESLQAGIPRGVPARPSPEAAAERPEEEALPGAVVVLSAESGGGGIGGILPVYGAGPLTLERLQAGATLSRRLGLPILVTGGSLEMGAPPIALQMARSLREDFGLAAAWVEPAAGDTWENAKFSAAILKGAGIRRVYLVSSAWHLRRALIAFRHFGLDAVPVADRFDPAPRLEFDSFVPRVSAWQKSYYALHEWIGCAYYALRRDLAGP